MQYLSNLCGRLRAIQEEKVGRYYLRFLGEQHTLCHIGNRKGGEMVGVMLAKEGGVCFALAPRLFETVKKIRLLRRMCVRMNMPYLKKKQPQQTINPQSWDTQEGDECSLPVFYGLYPNGEVKIWDELTSIPKEVLLFAEVQKDLNSSLFSVFFLCRYLWQRGVKKVTLAMPFCPYLRQDKPMTRGGQRKDLPQATNQMHREDLARRKSLDSSYNDIPQSSVFADRQGVHGWDVLKGLMIDSFVTHLYTLDAHASQDLHFHASHAFPLVLHNIAPQNLFVKEVGPLVSADQLLIIAPDQGAQERAQGLAQALSVDIRFVQKERDGSGQVQLNGISGAVEGRNCLIYDDILDSGSTLQAIAHMLKLQGALSLYALITHGILSEGLSAGLVEAYSRLYLSDALEWDHKNRTLPFLGQEKVVRVAILPFFLQEVLQKFQENK